MPSERATPYDNFDLGEDEAQIQRPPSEAPAPIVGDRGEPITKAPKKSMGGKIIGTIILVVAVIMIIGGVVVFAINTQDLDKAKAEDIAVDPATKVKDTGAKGIDSFQENVRRELEARELAERQEQERRDAAANASKPDLGVYGGGANAANTGHASAPPATGDDGEPVLTPAQKAAKRRNEDVDLLWTGTGGGQARAQSRSGGADLSSTPPDTTLSDSVRAERMADGKVGRPFNLKYQLKRGEYIPCTLLPMIRTDYAGFVDCQINRDVFSADGSVTLINRGAIAHGERKVAMNRGVSSVFASFNEIVNTDGTPIEIGSLATNSLGATGIDAEIDNHNVERFGGAIMLAGLDDAFSAVGKKLAGTEAQFDNSTENASDVAGKALDSTINMPPTGYVKPASLIYIYVARNVDFSTIYGVE
ncbi:TrbI/VirB10 family protein [Pseudomonas corrugata]|uniref:TrbI/VirB10 family protein n=1 Tax=Pseudomonas corrugata TaxID=47879 RepID=UPI0018E5E07D|nr:TrbI/VirB10 family protein [Pseudomonas corrugata]MBI6621570.1 TrbI/VirB10 family protein [Pseudomonas corrugata]MBI6694195.1 TrbI/VirB10 family protein [Pseudomonas corrugata]